MSSAVIGVAQAGVGIVQGSKPVTELPFRDSRQPSFLLIVKPVRLKIDSWTLATAAVLGA